MNPSASRSIVERLQARLAASRFFTFSLLLHVILVVMAGSVVMIQNSGQEPPDFTAGGVDLVTEETAPRHESREAQRPTVHAPSSVEPAVPPALVQDAIISLAKGPTTFVVPAAAPTSAAPRLSEALANVPAHDHRSTGALPPGMDQRRPGPKRAIVMRERGGKEKSEKAVMAGLRWLKQTQNESGSWTADSPTVQSAMTGLAVLCFLGHGELPESPEFGPTVKKAVDYLIAVGTKNQGKLVPNIDQPGCYAHPMAAYAMGEYFTMTKDDRVKDVLTQAIKYIVDGQAPDGGWQYGYAKGPDSDTSVAGWQIQALKAAHLTGLQIAGVDEALDKAMLNLKRVQSENGNFGYRKAGDRGNNPSLAGVGVLCTYFWKGDKDELVRDGIKFILESGEKAYPVKYKEDKADLYAWYYNTQACLMFGGNAWSKWNRWFQDEICDAQSPDGSWPPHGGKGHGENDGPKAQTYRTTLCILMLEVFYRYMPTTK